ncbi:hypothetical protein PV10_07126 [Exophiala mesophila]|uniref:Cytochrome P450 n=1 Tax=Exophiala mesophila TaxID=212818 RepID=A0A0D1XNR4_EXOME|nr:uncharacterized protein PV10_07126 [Exophiala mesophila]KIV89746.1 hypothetical protein PV10_07126 [Exophiala mesophila]
MITSSFLWTGALAAFVFLVYFSQARTRVHRDGKKLRRPPNTLPLLGNAIHFLKPRHQLFSWFVKCQKLFGHETFEISVPSLPPGVVINSPDNLEYVLKNEANITKGDFFTDRSWDLFGYGIINATGDLWKAQRKAGLKFFGGATLDSMIEDVLPEVYHSDSGMQRLLSQAAEDNTVVDLQKLFLDLTTTVVGYMAYDMEIPPDHPFSVAFDHASNNIGLRFQNPLWRLTEIFTGGAFRASLREVKQFGRHIILNARKRRARTAFESLITEADGGPPGDGLGSGFGTLIDSLIESFPNPTIVADAALNFLSAGRDTTAQSLTWTMYALLRNPEILPQLHTEIDKVFDPFQTPPSSPSSEHIPHVEQSAPDSTTIEDDLITTPPAITMSHLQPASLPTLYSIFYESLRLYPPIPFEIKQTLAPLTLPDGTFLPKDAVVVWCIWALNRSTLTFGPDAESFRPGRWLDDSGKRLVRRSEAEFPVFNGGPRACLGKKMAEVMVCWVLGTVLAEFEFELEDELEREADKDQSATNRTNGQERTSANSLTLPMLDGLPVRVRRRH